MAPSTATADNDKLPLRHKVGATVTPGDRLGLAVRGKTTFVPGKGTYLRQGHLYASLLGKLCATHHDDDGTSGKNEGMDSWIISIDAERPSSKDSQFSYSKSVCPRVGMMVLGRITRVVRPSHAMVDIVAIVPDDNQHRNNGSNTSIQKPSIVTLHEPYSGTLRQNEIRPNSSLEICIEDCIRPGDVILARVHANGERDFILTTAEAELGVIQAKCESSGCNMRSISWKEMQCPVTMAKEGRKVAKPRQQILRTAVS